MAFPTVTNNSPANGSIAWAAFNIQYQGNSYAIPAGSTAQRWVWWRYNGGSHVIQAGPDVPSDLTDDDLVIFGNKNGIAVRIQSTSYFDGELLVDGSILAEALAANIISSQHIVTAGLDAGVIKFGSMHGDRIAVRTLTAEKFSVGALGSNPITNPRFADRFANNNPYTGLGAVGWTHFEGIGYWVEQHEGAPGGYTVTLPSLDSGYGHMALAQPFPVTSGATYSAQVEAMFVANAPGFYYRIVWFDANMNDIGSTDVISNSQLSGANGGEGRKWFGGQVTVPSNAKFARPMFYNYPGNLNSYIYISEVRFQPVINGVDIRDGVINSIKIVTEGLDAAVIKFGTMSGDRIAVNTLNSGHIVTAGLDAGVIKFGEMSGDRITVNTLNGDRLIADTVAARSIVTGSLSALQMDVEAVASSIIETGILQSQLTITGVLQIDDADMGWSKEQGLYLGNGTVFYGDSRTNQIDGDLVTSSLSVKDGLSIGGNADHHGTMMMANGITTPTSQVSLSQTWPSMTSVVGDGTGDQSGLFMGLTDYSATTWVICFNYFGVGFRFMNKATGTWEGDKPCGPWRDEFYPQGGMCQLNGYWYIVGSDAKRQGRYFIYQLNPSGGSVTKTAEIDIGPFSYFSGRTYALVTNGTRIGLVYTSNGGNPGNLQINWYTTALTALDNTVVLMNDVGKVSVGDAYLGIGQAGGTSRLWVSLRQGDSGWVRCYTTAGARVASEDFPRAAGSTLLGLCYDQNGGSGRMYSYDKTGMFWTYSKYTAGGTLNAQHTWYDGDNSNYPSGTVINGTDVSGQASGFHETPPSPLKSYSLSRRAWPVITAPPAPDELVTDVTQVDKANRTGLYVSLGSTPRLQQYLPVGVRKLPLTDELSTSGALAGASGIPSFATASVPSPGRLRSAGESAGSPTIDLLGSGAGRMGPLRWGADSRPFNHGEYQIATAQNIPNATWTKRTNWSGKLGGIPAHGISYANGDFTVAQSGLWLIQATMGFEGATTTAGRRIVAINVGSITRFRSEAPATNASHQTTITCGGVMWLNAGSVISVHGYQNTGATLATLAQEECNTLSLYCLAAF